MWLADIFSSPAQNRFFVLLRQHTGILVEAARTLQRYVESGDAELADRVQDLEHHGDEVIVGLIQELRQSFVTPIDREDIYALGEGIDDTIDYLNNAARECRLFRVSATPEMREMARILVRSAEEIEKGVRAVTGSGDDALGHARAASQAENEMERVYRDALARLFTGSDVLAMFKLREIYRHFSNSADRADSTARTIAKIAVS
jgi:uncharacterized protein